MGYGCTTCIGNSGPLDEAVVDAIENNKLVAVSVLSGNRNFEGRVHANVRANYLASPPLVVAYALLGTTLHRFTLPVASLLGVIALAGGEMVLGALGVESALSIVIEFAGGLLFLFLLLTNRAR